MKVLVVANDSQKEELSQGATNEELHIEWVSDPGSFTGSFHFDACLDLLFENSRERIQLLLQLQAPLVIINSVVIPLTEVQEDFIRISGWNTFLKRPAIEAACNNELLKEKAERIFSGLGKKTEWVPDIPGLVTARVVASVINEAYFALEEKVSSKEEINTAMKLGTNYPYGPFEWTEKIGPGNIHTLLKRLAEEQKRYEPAALLTQEAFG
ncbi:MAG TPA: 3-hydroxyacyl-CoA dehydrogenase family protein [Chitinophagaceae bacterium]